VLSASSSGGSPFQHEFNPPISVGERSDIVLRCLEVSANDTTVDGGFGIVLVDN
jgi:hypothetical protein